MQCIDALLVWRLAVSFASKKTTLNRNASLTPLRSMLMACKYHVMPCAIIINSEDAFVLDKEDSSITRSNEHFHEIYRRAGLMVIKEQLQTKYTSLSVIAMHLFH